MRRYRQISTDVRRDWAKLLSASAPQQAQPQREIELEELERMVKAATAPAKDSERPPGEPEPTQERKAAANQGQARAETAPADEYARTYSTVPSKRKEAGEVTRTRTHELKRRGARGSPRPPEGGEWVSQLRI